MPSLWEHRHRNMNTSLFVTQTNGHSNVLDIGINILCKKSADDCTTSRKVDYYKKSANELINVCGGLLLAWYITVYPQQISSPVITGSCCQQTNELTGPSPVANYTSGGWGASSASAAGAPNGLDH